MAGWVLYRIFLMGWIYWADLLNIKLSSNILLRPDPDIV